MTTALRDRYARGKASLVTALLRARSDSLSIPRHLTGSEWAEKHGRLSAETSAQTGRIHLYGYQRGLLDAFADPSIVQVTALKAARVGYTRAIDLIVGYYLHHDPSPVLVVQPTIADAEDYSRTEIGPMLRDTECLAAIMREDVGRDEARNTLLNMQFKSGAILKLRGAASDDAFRRITTRVNIGDEVDADGWNTGGESGQGDKLAQMEKRGDTFWDSRLIIGSTPRLEETSRVWREWLASDQRRYFVPCPRCTEKAGHLDGWQYLKWGSGDLRYGVKWKADEAGEIIDAWYVCEHCGGRVEQHEKHWMDERGEWRPTAKPKRRGHAGFHMWTGMSLYVKADWKIMAHEWCEAQAKPHELLQPFVNLRLGMPWKETAKKTEPAALAKRREDWAAEVPDQAVLLVAGVDNQSGANARFEVSVLALGRNEETWVVGHYVIGLPPDSPEGKEALDDLLRRPFLKADGTKMWIQAACLDFGGHYNDEIRDFCAARTDRRVWAVKGRNLKLGKRSASIWPSKASTRRGYVWYVIDTALAKDLIARRLKVGEPGPGYVHFSAKLSDAYFAGLTAEELVVKMEGRDRITYWHCPDGKRNEPLDCYVYAWAAYRGLKSTDPDRWDLNRLADKIGIPAYMAAKDKAASAVPASVLSDSVGSVRETAADALSTPEKPAAPARSPAAPKRPKRAVRYRMG